MLKTEMRNESTTYIDRASTKEMLQMINKANFEAAAAVENALPQIEKAVEAVTDAISKGGKLIYVGAGTSGRLSIADAAECPPTFDVDYNTVIAIIAGGEKTLVRASENQEDYEYVGRADLLNKDLSEKDIVCGISASGGAAYVAGALKEAKEHGCKTISLIR